MKLEELLRKNKQRGLEFFHLVSAQIAWVRVMLCLGQTNVGSDGV